MRNTNVFDSARRSETALGAQLGVQHVLTPVTDLEDLDINRCTSARESSSATIVDPFRNKPSAGLFIIDRHLGSRESCVNLHYSICRYDIRLSYCEVKKGNRY